MGDADDDVILPKTPEELPLKEYLERWSGMAKAVGIWHPFGTHAGETRYAIVSRKMREIHDNGWTLWSFQFRNLAALMLERPTFVLCSDSPGASDPRSEPVPAAEYRAVGSETWVPLPPAISVPHPFHTPVASAFVVDGIERLTDQPQFGISWLRTKDMMWRDERLPTRGEYVIRTDGTLRPRRAFAILRLREPWLVHIRAATRATVGDVGDVVVPGTSPPSLPRGRIRDAAPEEELIGAIIIGGVRRPHGQVREGLPEATRKEQDE